MDGGTAAEELEAVVREVVGGVVAEAQRTQRSLLLEWRFRTQFLWYFSIIYLENYIFWIFYLDLIYYLKLCNSFTRFLQFLDDLTRIFQKRVFFKSQIKTSAARSKSIASILQKLEISTNFFLPLIVLLSE